MVIRLSARLISIFILVLIAAASATFVLRATPEGLTLSDDSIAYIAGARSMIAGHGYREAWLASNGPVTHFPPAYPAALTVLGWTGLDPVRGARFLGAVLSALNAVLLGILGWRMTRWLPAGLMLAALFVLSGPLLRVHATALSEPLFIFFSLLAFWMFDLYRERDAHWLWLVACGTFVGLAYLTRYAALGLAATFGVALLLLHADWRKRLISIGVFAASIAPWVLGWAVRNLTVGGSATNRVLVWHPITTANFETALRNASEFLMPVEAWRRALLGVPGLLLLILLLILLGVLAYVLVRVRRREAGALPIKGEVISIISALFVFGYLASIVAAMSFFDASTKFRVRILSPVYVALLILAVALGSWLWKRRRWLAIALSALVLGFSSYGLVSVMTELSRGAQGYASFRWYDSQAVELLRELPADVMIYTNEPGAVYLHTGRPTYVLPDRVDPVTAASRPEFERGVQELQDEVNAGRAVLAIFSGGDSPDEDVVALTTGLALIHKSGGAEIYGAAE